MKAVIFAGGVGTRLWPLSRKKSPKQFEKIIGSKSTLQLTVKRLLPEFKPEDIFISTDLSYIEIIKKQLPMIPADNIIGEPAKKDVGPAVALVMTYLASQYDPTEPVVILWSDHLVQNEKKFAQILQASSSLIEKNKEKIIFIGQKPRFASDNLGWIEYGPSQEEENNIQFHTFKGFKYKPAKNVAEVYVKSGKHCWNLGYFVSTPHFVLNQFKRFAPAIYEGISSLLASPKGTFAHKLQTVYPKMPVIHFDNAVLERLNPKDALVVVEDIGWSDVGAWEALKEALEEKREDNVVLGNVHIKDSVDNLIYNYEDNKMVVGVDLEDMLVVNTGDALLVAKKTSVAKVKKIVESFAGTDKEHLT